MSPLETSNLQLIPFLVVQNLYSSISYNVVWFEWQILVFKLIWH